jgi:hypothetical protein
VSRLTEYRDRRRTAKVQAAVQTIKAALPAGSGYLTDPSKFPIATPFGSSDLQRIVFQDIFGTGIPSNTRAAAMALPPIARARNLLCGTLARFPLRALTGQTANVEQPQWLTHTGDGSSPQLRQAWTTDDHLFYGWSCWDRVYDGGEWVASSRINYEDWTINDDLEVEVNGSVVDPASVLVIPGLHEGILTYGAQTIDDISNLYKIVRARLLNPVPQLNLHQTGGDPMTPTQIDDLIGRWAAARQGQNGGVSFTNQSIEVDELGSSGDAQLLIEARNAAAVDLARIVGVHDGMLDATAPKASLNYETQTGRNEEFVDFDLALYMTPVSARLSLDDCTAPGTRVDFDLADFTAPAPSPTGPNLED